MKCAGKWLHLGLSVDAISGLALTIDEVGAEDAEALKEWMEPIAKSVGAQVLVTDDADGFKTVADELCPKVARDADGSLHACGVDPGQAQADLKQLGKLIVRRSARGGDTTARDATLVT